MHFKTFEKLIITSLIVVGITTPLLVYAAIKEPTFEKIEVTVEKIPITSTENSTFSIDSVLDSSLDEFTTEEYINNTSVEDDTTANKIRCTGYCDYGYTKSGEYVHEGVIAGKEEWLGLSANIYEVNADGSKGKLIGNYKFLDTGYGINGSLIDGTSVDIWHPSEEAVWEWVDTYGDYVYIEIL